ncbi:cytidine deaminase [Lachancea thermotolerans CBS 6340]|uniref:Cytidine deaminase n=1 Tax=Lachancea thermotolerans (strain ATCC 56472 / CBS 6340 / NRRL Y-8284) TaxID=559295 RepID=C5DKZ0_LACTC|nr:KLTH0F08624p [Lachancea thermotolerans CBS 6340]CAR24141.1 KLTH0F08624p [Lachancea thermotolerans CBS 6340]
MQMNSPLEHLSTEEFEKLKRNALEARQRSYSPYSKFRVGCCIMLQSKECILGANVENASYGGAICAERTAAVKAVTSGFRSDWLCMAISGDSLETCISPCGICRQVIREFASLKMPIVMFNGDGSKHMIKTLQDLLPLSFGPEDLAE